MEPALWPVFRYHHFSKKVGSVPVASIGLLRMSAYGSAFSDVARCPGLSPSCAAERTLISRFDHAAARAVVVPVERIELPTFGLSN
jgi:hypothetical protein